MNSRAYLLAAFLVSPAWSQDPAAEAPVPAAPSFDLRSAAIQKIVRDTAASQFAYVQVSVKAPVEAEPAEFVYVPPEKPAAPLRESPRRPAAPPPASDGFLSALFDILIDEALGTDDVDEVTASNDMLRCRVQKEIKSIPPGVDNCPSVY